MAKTSPATPDAVQAENALDDLEGIGHLLGDLSALAEQGDSPAHHRSLYFLGVAVRGYVDTIRAHLAGRIREGVAPGLSN